MEFFTPVRVVVVDDRPDHLFAVANALAVSGIPCVWHLYDSSTNRLVPPPPLEGYPDIRLIVSDLNIREIAEAGRDPKNLAAILLSEVLLPLLPKFSCAYGLVLWSSVQVKADEVAAIIEERISHSKLDIDERRSKPLSVSFLDKTRFVTVLPSSGELVDLKSLLDGASANVSAVVEMINSAIKDLQLRLVCAWESRVSQAAASAVNSVHAAAETHCLETNLSPSTSLQQVLAKIAREASGKDARDSPSRALDDGLVDLLIDGLRSTDDLDSYECQVRNGIGSLLSGPHIKLSDRARHQLNTDLQIESKISPNTKNITRGLILSSTDEGEVLESIWGRGLKSVLWDEFLFGTSSFRDAAKNALEIEHPEAERLREIYERAKLDKVPAEEECRFRLLEIGADCDHAQRKSRTVRLLCALEVPERFAYLLSRPGGSGELKSASLLALGPWVLDDANPTHLVVSVSRFHVLQHWELSKGFMPMYRLRKPLVDLVLHKYASHSVRPGYIAITK